MIHVVMDLNSLKDFNRTAVSCNTCPAIWLSVIGYR